MKNTPLSTLFFAPSSSDKLHSTFSLVQKSTCILHPLKKKLKKRDEKEQADDDDDDDGESNGNAEMR